MMWDKLSIGFNPFGEPQSSIAKFSGMIFAPVDGQYTFAASAQNRGALYIDSKPVVFAHGSVGDVQFNAKVDLKRGKHDVMFLQAHTDGDPRMSVVWKRPDQNKYEVIGAEFFGAMPHVMVGGLEEHNKTITADFRLEYLGESFYANHYSHRYRLTGQLAKPFAGAKYEWDFGDGQMGSGPVMEHVYLNDGDYVVKVAVHVGGNVDLQSTTIHVSRVYERLDNPPNDPLGVQSKIVQAYDVAKIPANIAGVGDAAPPAGRGVGRGHCGGRTNGPNG